MLAAPFCCLCGKTEDWITNALVFVYVVYTIGKGLLKIYADLAGHF